MAKNYINFEKIERLTEIDKDVPIEHRAIKLSEETGEFSQAILKFLGSKNVSASAGNEKIDVLEELCDVLNVTVDLINVLGFSDKEVQAMFEKKLNKWESKQKKYTDNPAKTEIELIEETEEYKKWEESLKELDTLINSLDAWDNYAESLQRDYDTLLSQDPRIK